MPRASDDSGQHRGFPVGAARDQKRPRPARRAARGPQLTERDKEILAWIATHGVVTTSQVAERFFQRDDGQVGKWAAYGRVKALEELELLRRDAVYWKAPHVLRVTREGSRVANVGLGPAHLVVANVPHDVAVVDLVEQLAAENPQAALTTERQLWAQWYRDLRDGIRRAGTGRMPDGMLTLADGKRVAIELDLTSKRSTQVRDIISAYLTADFDAVWWYVRGEKVADRYGKLVAELQADDLISVRVWRTG